MIPSLQLSEGSGSEQRHTVSGFSIKLYLEFSRFRIVGLGMRTNKNKKNVVNETFPKVNQVNECQVDGKFLFSHEQIGIGGIFLVPMEAPVDVYGHETKGAVFNNEIEDCTNYMGRWALCRQEMLVFPCKINDG